MGELSQMTELSCFELLIHDLSTHPRPLVCRAPPCPAFLLPKRNSPVQVFLFAVNFVEEKGKWGESEPCWPTCRWTEGFLVVFGCRFWKGSDFAGFGEK